MPPSKAEIERWKADGSQAADTRTRFRFGPVFDRCQVDALPPPAEATVLDPPIVEVVGDELGWTYPRLVALAAEMGVSVAIEEMSQDRGGYYQPDARRIGLNQSAPARV